MAGGVKRLGDLRLLGEEGWKSPEVLAQQTGITSLRLLERFLEEVQEALSELETMMDHTLRTISYIADIGNIVVLMARRRMPRPDSTDSVEVSEPDQEEKQSQYKMICHVFESEDVRISLYPYSLTSV
eukprot:XP_014043166.1 PREDICTED: amyloid beta A4 precursor protein-binding family A member 1-like [Salmo salar]